MKKYCLAINVVFCIVLWNTVDGMNPQRLRSIQASLESGRCHNVDALQSRVLAMLHECPHLTMRQIDSAIDILIFGHGDITTRFQCIHENLGRIESSIENFSQTPGFIKALREYLALGSNPFAARGRFFVLANALDIAEKDDDETVTAFGKPEDCDIRTPYQHEHNVITNKQWLECKTINWTAQGLDRRCRKLRRMQDQFLSQKAVVEEYNESKDHNLVYGIASMHPLPTLWTDFFDAHTIPWHDAQTTQTAQ